MKFSYNKWECQFNNKPSAICISIQDNCVLSSPTPLKFLDLNLKNEVTYYRATGPMDKCNRVPKFTMTGDPYKKACRLVSLNILE